MNQEKYSINLLKFNEQQNILPVKPITEPESKVGIVISTCYRNNLFVIQNIKAFRKFLPTAKIFLYMNEVIEKEDIKNICIELNVETFIIDNQTINGGLTANWNSGILECIKNNCNIIILSNDDLFINKTINNIINEALTSFNNQTLEYFGPISNNPDHDITKKSQQFIAKDQLSKSTIISPHYLNGFFMVFPIHVLLKMKFDNTYFFNPKFPFGGNETEWYERFKKKGGKSIVVQSTFVYHYKLKLWRKDTILKNTCFFTINTQSYDDKIIIINSKYDFFYFTDNEEDVYKCVKLNIIPFILEKSNNPKLQQRTIKTSPHLYLPPNYNVSIYIDANVIPKIEVIYKLVEKIKDNNIDLIHVMHPRRNNIKDEALEVIKLRLEIKDNIDKIMDFQKKDNFEDNVGLSETAVLIRKHNNIIKFNEKWTNCIKICIRDQISFNYLLWKYNILSLNFSNTNAYIYTKTQHNNNTLTLKREFIVQ